MKDVSALARDFARALDCALDDALALTRALTRARSRALASDFDRDFDLDRDCARALDLARALAVELDFTLDPDLVGVSASALDLARALDDVRALAHDYARALNKDRTAVLDSDLDRDLDLVAGHLQALRDPVHAMAKSLTTAPDIVRIAAPGVRSPWRVATQMTEWVVRVLPVADQSYYREIYRSDLFELAQSSSPRRTQLACVFRLAVTVVSLRRALRTSAPQPRSQRR